MDANMVRLREYANELYRLTDKVISSDGNARVRFAFGTGKVLCRVMVAEDEQELTNDENVYCLFSDPEKQRITSMNYQNCRRRLIRIVTENKKP